MADLDRLEAAVIERRLGPACLISLLGRSPATEAAQCRLLSNARLPLANPVMPEYAGHEAMRRWRDWGGAAVARH